MVSSLMTEPEDTVILNLAARIVTAYVAANPVEPDQLPELIRTVGQTLKTVGEPEQPEPEPLVPAVNPKKSIFREYIVCLEDGKRLKMLKRHLKTSYNMTPDEYRRRWGLPQDYPMTAPSYAETRSTLAKRIGLGRKPESGATEEPKMSRAAAGPAEPTPRKAAKPAAGRKASARRAKSPS